MDSQLIVPNFGNQQLTISCPPSNFNQFYFNREFIVPLITLISPLSNSEDTDGFIDFYYKVKDSSYVNCTLYLDNNAIETHNINPSHFLGGGNFISNTDFFSIHNPPVKNILSWFVSCTDVFGNIGNSETWFIDTQIGSGGGGGTNGGGGISENETILIKLCELTYDFNSFTQQDVINIQENYSSLTGKLISVNLINFYLNNWQRICSDKLNKSKNESFVCNGIYDYIYNDNNTSDLLDINTLISKLQKSFEISPHLIKYYIKHYKKLCFDTNLSPKIEIPKTFSIATDFKVSSLVVFIIILIFLTGGLLLYLIFRKNKIVSVNKLFDYLDY